MLGMQRSKTSADQKRKQRPYTLILFNQNIVWGFLTKFGTKIDSYKMDVYGTSGISKLAVIFKMALKAP